MLTLGRNYAPALRCVGCGRLWLPRAQPRHTADCVNNKRIALTDCDECEPIIWLEGEVEQKWFVALK